MADISIFAYPLWLGWWCTHTPNVPLPASASPRAPSPSPSESTLPCSTLWLLSPFCSDLGTEYLTCDCRLRWLLPWARNHSLQLSERTLCAYPSALHAQALGGLQEAQLRCGEHSLPLHTCPLVQKHSRRAPAGSRLPLP